MKVEVLGTGGAVSESSTSYLINDHILVDCGIDIVKDLILTKKIDLVDTVFLTHLHMDHVNGFELIVFYLQFMKKEISVYAGPDFESFYRQLKCSTDINSNYYQPFIFIDINKLSFVNIVDTPPHK